MVCDTESREWANGYGRTIDRKESDNEFLELKRNSSGKDGPRNEG